MTEWQDVAARRIALACCTSLRQREILTKSLPLNGPCDKRTRRRLIKRLRKHGVAADLDEKTGYISIQGLALTAESDKEWQTLTRR